MAARPTVRYTYRDYLAIPEDTARRHEIVDGELHVSAAPRFRHQAVVTNLVRVLDSLVRPAEVWSPELLDPERPRDVLRWQVGGEALRVELAGIFE